MTFSVTDLRKSFSGIPVLKGVNLSVRDGEIHALLGANGAGKSTLIKCISGAITPDSGTIDVDGTKYRSLTPRSSCAAGVSVVYQDLSLAASLNVAENVFLGQEMRVGPFVRHRSQRAEVETWLDELGVPIDPDASLSSLSSADLQVIEIIKSLRAQPKVLILDEPTASLTEREADELGRHLLSLKQKNIPLLYVTHRLAEVFALADRVTILRGGEVVLSSPVSDVTQADLVSAIVGKDVSRQTGSGAVTEDTSKPRLLSLKKAVAYGIGPVDLDIREGEIVGVFGLTGSGRTELLETVFGARKLQSGTMSLAGKKLELSGPQDAVAVGIALVPSDRLRLSILGDLPAMDNMLLPRFGWIGKLGIRRKQVERKKFEDTAERLNLQPRRGDLLARRFSGGNQQKLVLGRWLQDGDICRLMLLDEPTQGVDVGARSDLYTALKDFVKPEGRAVMVTSSEPEELMQISDRVIVLSGGRIVAEVRGKDINEDNLITLAHGQEHVAETQ